MKPVSGERGRNRRTRKKGRPGKRPPKATGPQSSRSPAGWRRNVLLKATAHPLRRRMLLAIAGENLPLGPGQLARELDLPLDLIAYHTRVLQRCGALEEAGREDG
jgi:Helix-turn-helix domain